MNPTPFNIEEFGKKSEDYYNEIRTKIEPSNKGKYVALDFEHERYWLGDTASEALANAKKESPDKLFYLFDSILAFWLL